MDLKGLMKAIEQFARDRDWEQFHNPKDLALALGIEAAELQEHFLWTPAADSQSKVNAHREAVENEVGDVLIYLLRFCQISGIDPLNAASHKLTLNAEKYPIETSRGTSKKYTELYGHSRS